MNVAKDYFGQYSTEAYAHRAQTVIQEHDKSKVKSSALLCVDLMRVLFAMKLPLLEVQVCNAIYTYAASLPVPAFPICAQCESR